MIERNLKLRQDDSGFYLVMSKLDEYELAELRDKYKGEVHVKVGPPMSAGTEQQNRALHALLAAYYATGMHSAHGQFAESLAAFKVWVKMQYGPCWCFNMDGQEVKAPKSWADYTKLERMELIDGLLAEINQSGAAAASSKIQEIIAGMQMDK